MPLALEDSHIPTILSHSLLLSFSAPLKLFLDFPSPTLLLLTGSQVNAFLRLLLSCIIAMCSNMACTESDLVEEYKILLKLALNCFTGKKTANKNIEVTMHVLSDDGTILEVFVGWLSSPLQISL